VGGQRHAPAALPSGKTQYPLYRRLGGPQGRSGQVRKSRPPLGFDPRTVRPLASRYTDCLPRPTEEARTCRKADDVMMMTKKSYKGVEKINQDSRFWIYTVICFVNGYKRVEVERFVAC